MRRGAGRNRKNRDVTVMNKRTIKAGSGGIKKEGGERRCKKCRGGGDQGRGIRGNGVVSKTEY